jgi:hypothetical protein
VEFVALERLVAHVIGLAGRELALGIVGERGSARILVAGVTSVVDLTLHSRQRLVRVGFAHG